MKSEILSLISVIAILALLRPAASSATSLGLADYLAAQTKCPVVTSSGITTMSANYAGAPNSASPLANFACVKIAASNVIFDCAGHSITNNGISGTTYGILINGSLKNVTVRNCPSISGYTYGVYVYKSNNSNITNTTASSSLSSAIFINGGSSASVNCRGRPIVGTNATGTYGIYSSQFNTTIMNCNISNFSIAIFFNGSTNGTIRNTSASTSRTWDPTGNGLGILLANTNYSQIMNTSATSGDYDAIGLYSGSSGNTIANTTAIAAAYPIDIEAGSNSNTVTNVNATATNHDAIYLYSSSNNTISGTSARAANYDAILLQYSSNNTISNTKATAPGWDAIVFQWSSNNSISGTVANTTGPYAIYFTEGCNYNTISNTTAIANIDDAIQFITDCSYNTISNTNVTSGSYSVVFEDNSNNDSIVNSNVNAATDYAVSIWTSSNSTVSGTRADAAGSYGIYLDPTSNSSTIINSTGISSLSGGIYINSSDDNTIINSTALGSLYGLYLYLSNGTLLSNVHYYNNSYDFFVVGASSFNMSNAIFDNPRGSFQNFTNLSINDSVNDAESYSINWSSNTSALPSGYSSFAQKFVNIAAVSGTPSIDQAVWSWTNGELVGYDESRFSLLGYNGSWNLLNGSPDITDHQLSMTGLTPSAVYGILESN